MDSLAMTLIKSQMHRMSCVGLKASWLQVLMSLRKYENFKTKYSFAKNLHLIRFVELQI